MHNLYPVLAIALFYIGFLGLYHKRNISTLFMFILNFSLALWTLCNFAIHYPELFPFTKIFVITKLVLFIFFTFGFCGLSLSYPISLLNSRSKVVSFLSALIAFSCMVVFFPSYFILANIVDGKIVGEAQIGYLFYGVVIIFIWVVSFYNLYQSSKKYIRYRGELSFLIFSLICVIGVFILTNIVLLNLGVNQYIFVGRFIMPLGFSFLIYYSILNYNLLHIQFLMKPIFVWVNTLLIFLVSALIAYFVTDSNSPLQIISILSIVALSAFYGHKLQLNITKSVKSNLLPGWYDRQKLLKSLMHELTYLFDKDKIFEAVKYKLISNLEINNITLFKAFQKNSFVLKDYFSKKTTPVLFVDLPQKIQNRLLNNCEFKLEIAAVLPLISPQGFKGLMVISTRNSKCDFTQQDMEFFLQIQNIVSASLYRISPQNEIEKAYYQTRDKIEWMQAFAGNIAHELRTPLATISLSSRCIERSIENMEPVQKEDTMRSINIINSVLNKSQKTISMLLENIKHRRLSMSDLTWQSIAKTIQNALDEYPFDEFQKELVQFNASRDFKANLSKEVFIMVIFNLLKNALYYLKSEGKGDIKIYLKPGKKYNKVIFIDTAKGISKQNLQKIFDPFYSNKRNAQGHGLGLSFCKQVMQEHNGDITCRSKEGEFTEFTLSLPVRSE